MKHRIGSTVLAAALLAIALFRSSPVRAAEADYNAADTWAFNPKDDAFATDCLLDLRDLNEKTAGEHGVIRLSADGMSFVRGDGRPIRFWAANVDGQKTQAEMDAQVRFLAKKGVNMIRLHRSVPNDKEGSKITDVDEKEIDTIFRYVAAAKKAGVYVTLSPYWAHLTAPKSWNIADYGGQALWGVMFINDDLQAAYRAWTKELYTRVNPYTGVALKDEPALAIIQVKNEDSLLFWTFQGIKPAQMRILGKKYAAWLTKRYGSPEKALEAWGGEKAKGDDLANGVVGFYPTFEMIGNATGSKAKRLNDQTHFIAEIQRQFYADMVAHYRSLGCKQLTNAMNWRSADPVKLDDLERWTYTATDIPAANIYYGGLHVGKNNGYRIDPGHHFTNASVLRNPREFTDNLKQTVGRPMIITEAAWTHPNLYQTEAPFLMGAYQSLTGVDVTYWFAMNAKEWLLDPRRKFWPVGDSYAVDKWSANTYATLGMFPAAAVAFRGDYVREADKPVVYEERRLEDLYERRIPIISESGKFDPNRDAGSFSPQSTIKQEIDRLAFLAGPVHVKYGGDASNNRVDERLASLIGKDDGVVRSVTGELAFDYKNGVCTVATEKFAGVCGFLKAAGGSFAPGKTVSIKSDNDYAAISVVALDGQPLDASKRVLIQVGTLARLTGFASKPAKFQAEGGGKGKAIEGEEIVNTGKPPYLVSNAHATVGLKNAAVTKATLLDPNGYAIEDVPLNRDGGGVSIELPAETMYLLLQ
jgi:hypothetical protein